MPVLPKSPIVIAHVTPPPTPPKRQGTSTTVPAYAPVGSSYNQQGKLVNNKGQLLNSKGQAVNKQGQLINSTNQRVNERGQLVNKSGQPVDNKGRLINENNHLINSQGKLINANKQLVDEQGRLVNHSGRLVNDSGHLIDKDGKRVNIDGVLIDKTGRPLDKNGKVARDQTNAVKGNNEPHVQLLPSTIRQKALDWKNKIPPPASPPKLAMTDVITRMMDAEKMVKNGIIPSSPSAAVVARDAAISAGITGVVSAPINIAAYAGSTAAAEQIKAAYVPLPMIPPTPIAKSSVERPDQTAMPAPGPDLNVLYPRMNDDQALAFGVANQSIALKFGDTKTGFIPAQSWSKEPLERMSQLENLLDFAEEHTKELADPHEIYFKPYLAETPAVEGLEGLDARLATIEKRIGGIDKVHKMVLSKLAERTA